MTGGQSLLRRTGRSGRGDAYVIRPTREADVAAIVELHDAVAAEGVHLAAVPGDRGVVEEGLALAGLLNGGGLSLVVEVAGAVAGNLLIQRFQARYHRHRAELAVVLRGDLRGAGLGRAMMIAGIDWARAVGVTKLFLTVFPDNAAAIGLYRSLGFETEGLCRHQVLMPDGYRDVLAMGLLVEGPARPDILPAR